MFSQSMEMVLSTRCWKYFLAILILIELVGLVLAHTRIHDSTRLQAKRAKWQTLLVEECTCLPLFQTRHVHQDVLFHQGDPDKNIKHEKIFMHNAWYIWGYFMAKMKFYIALNVLMYLGQSTNWEHCKCKWTLSLNAKCKEDEQLVICIGQPWRTSWTVHLKGCWIRWEIVSCGHSTLRLIWCFKRYWAYDAFIDNW